MISRQTSPSRKLSTLLFSASVALLAATGCHKKAKTLPPPAALPPASAPAPTATLTADPTAIDQGQSVVLNWRTTNATSVSIDGIGNVATNGTQTVTPSSSTNFHLVAKGDGGTTDANVRVTVRVPTVPESGNINESDAAAADAAFHAAVKDLFFDYDSYDIRQADESSVTAAASYINAHPNLKILIAGYCDDRGSAEYNITLGENRANAAKQALTAAGVNPNRIRVVSYGKERQFCTEENEACWQQNRRAQFNVDR
jgi:peptidoglycan-associated lipoprotein